MKRTRSPLRLLVLTQRFESEEQLAEHLLGQDSDAGGPDVGRYLYRGQGAEYRRQWPLRAGTFRPLAHDDLVNPACWELHPTSLTLPIPLEPYTFDLPSLIPTDTRAYETHLWSAGREGRTDEPYEETITLFAISVCVFIVGLAAIKSGSLNAADWYQAQLEHDFPHLYKLRSIGQHYGMDTGLLDATSSIPVALWFASHSFRSGEYLSRKESIIYRIDRFLLREVEQWAAALPEHDGEFDATSIDIRDTPQDVAPRAYRQQGWSLVGWDHPRLMIRMVATGGLTQYCFRTGAVPSRMNALEHEYVVPSADPVRAIFEKFWTHQPESLDAVQAWIDQHWNRATARPIRITDAAWRRQLVAEMGRLFDYYLPGA
jgi:hypothetical protein